MDLLATMEIERECGRLPLLFARYADSGDHAALAQLFTEDCDFARPFQPDHPFHGRDRVQAIFRDRPPILVRHIVTNVLIEVISPTEARGTNYLAMLSSHASTEPPQEAGALCRRVRGPLRQDRRGVAVQEPPWPGRVAPGRCDAQHPGSHR